MAVVGNAAMEGRTVPEWDKDDIDALGLLKVDVLALGMLSCLRRGFALFKQHHRLELDLAGVPRDCAATYVMLRRLSQGVPGEKQHAAAAAGCCY